MAHPGTLHAYTSGLTAFEHAVPDTVAASKSSNIVLWIGGLGDGLLGVRYPTEIAKSLPPDWSIAEVLLTSSYNGWGTGSLKRDAKEIGEAVAYFQKLRPGAKVVLMGHSTGCQDIMEYLVGPESAFRPTIRGAILQAGVSDRQAWDDMAAEDDELKKGLKHTMELAQKLIAGGHGDEYLPRNGNPVSQLFGSPCTAYRANSLLAPGGDDDYFSTDLPDETLKTTFGKIPKKTKMMLLWGSKDPYIPPGTDMEGTLKKWASFVKEAGGEVDEVNGGVIEGATHNLNDDPEQVVQNLVKRVVGFVEDI